MRPIEGSCLLQSPPNTGTCQEQKQKCYFHINLATVSCVKVLVISALVGLLFSEWEHIQIWKSVIKSSERHDSLNLNSAQLDMGSSLAMWTFAYCLAAKFLVSQTGF